MNLPPVLVVDDDVVAAAMAQRTLNATRLANPVVVLHSAEAAVTLLADEEAREPALVLLDVTLPGMSGVDFLRWMRSTPLCRTTPVVMVTASDDAKHINEAHEYGVDAFLVKRVAYGALLDVVPQLQLPWAFLPRDHQPRPVEASRNQA